MTDLPATPTVGDNLTGYDLAGHDVAGHDVAGHNLTGDDLAGHDVGRIAANLPPGGAVNIRFRSQIPIRESILRAAQVDNGGDGG